ncbi:hypothetical protein, partial [Candidatus Nitrosotenuis chungbukensis]
MACFDAALAINPHDARVLYQKGLALSYNQKHN